VGQWHMLHTRPASAEISISFCFFPCPHLSGLSCIMETYFNYFSPTSRCHEGFMGTIEWLSGRQSQARTSSCNAVSLQGQGIVSKVV